MKTKLKHILCSAILGLTLSTASVQAQEADGPKVQIAILLDTSGSMEGLINQAKTQLWKIVNEFIAAKQNGRTPYVEVALYQYGNDGLDAGKHWIQQIQPLTRDLDKVSQDLFALRTNGGSEFCGAVIQRSVNDLKWDSSPNTYKAIFIAGNEPFTQGPIQPKSSCREAIGKGIIVNTIHCGSEREGLQGEWATGALLADGKFMNIDQNAAVAHISAPQDAEIVKLNEELNQTYVWYGREAKAKAANQAVQDKNAEENAAAGASVQRAASKASANYWNADADLVDAVKQKEFDLTKVKDEELPEAMRKLDAAGRAAYVKEHAEKREKVQKKILELNKAREAYVAEKLKEQGKETLDTAVTKAVREQAAKKNIVWEEAKGK